MTINEYQRLAQRRLLRVMFTPARVGAKLCGMVSETAARLKRTRREYRGGEENEAGQSV